MHAIRLLVFVACVTTVIGCGGKAGPSAVLKGKVTYKGQPLKAGSMNFYSDSGMYEAPIRPDGTYMLNSLPLLTFKVTVDTDAFDPEQKTPSYANAMSKGYAKGMNAQYSEYNKMSGGGQFAGEKNEASGALSKEKKAELAKIFTKIPARYGDKKLTPLMHTVEPGEHTWDIELAD